MLASATSTWSRSVALEINHSCRLKLDHAWDTTTTPLTDRMWSPAALSTRSLILDTLVLFLGLLRRSPGQRLYGGLVDLCCSQAVCIWNDGEDLMLRGFLAQWIETTERMVRHVLLGLSINAIFFEIMLCNAVEFTKESPRPRLLGFLNHGSFDYIKSGVCSSVSKIQFRGFLQR